MFEVAGQSSIQPGAIVSHRLNALRDHCACERLDFVPRLFCKMITKLINEKLARTLLSIAPHVTIGHFGLYVTKGLVQVFGVRSDTRPPRLLRRASESHNRTSFESLYRCAHFTNRFWYSLQPFFLLGSPMLNEIPLEDINDLVQSLRFLLEGEEF